MPSPNNVQKCQHLSWFSAQIAELLAKYASKASKSLLLTMRKLALPLLLTCFYCFCYDALLSQSSISLKAGMIISQNTLIDRNQYQITADSNNKKSIILISGNNITVDFNQAVLDGSLPGTLPNEMSGLAIKISAGSSNIVIKNLIVKGYKIAILADSVNQLTINNCNLSYNWRQQLHSTREKEDISDWLSFHKNEKDEWMRYGAAIYLKNCKESLIQNNIVTGTQCALLMTNCTEAQVMDNDFSFNSGIGIGMYRSSFNLICHNKLDFNVRGQSFQKYRRGQDSAGILVFEQSSENIFAYNSATHSGDGFFLWAGQTTMDTGIGGCNNNLIYGNDFSFAPTNGAELTFSTNTVLHNRITDCMHGIWAGYSYGSDFSDNKFSNNKIGIAIEHGQGINIALNTFLGDETGIKLWSREKQPADWAYAKLRNTNSKNYWIASNSFINNGIAYDIMGTDTAAFSGNKKSNVQTEWKKGPRLSEIDIARENDTLDLDYQTDKRLAPIKYKSIPEQYFPQGIKEMRITQWGPYDFRSPLLWLATIDSNQLYHFEVLGPKGKWNIKSIEGFEVLSASSDSMPATLLAKIDSNHVQPTIQLQYLGAATTSIFGKQIAANTPQTFQYQLFQPKTNWQIQYFKWDSLSHPEKQLSAFYQLLETRPLKTFQSKELNFIWWGKLGDQLPVDSFATVATSTIDFPKGEYQIGITADDLVKVFMDGKEIINAWEPNIAAYDESTHHQIKLSINGKHQFKIIQADYSGLATLQFHIQPISFLKQE